jgi:hypothetical protein
MESTNNWNFGLSLLLLLLLWLLLRLLLSLLSIILIALRRLLHRAALSVGALTLVLALVWSIALRRLHNTSTSRSLISRLLFGWRSLYLILVVVLRAGAGSLLEKDLLVLLHLLLGALLLRHHHAVAQRHRIVSKYESVVHSCRNCPNLSLLGTILSIKLGCHRCLIHGWCYHRLTTHIIIIIS